MTNDTSPRPDPIAALVEQLIAIYGMCIGHATDPGVRYGAHPGDECSRLFSEAIEAALRADADAQPPQLPSWLTDRIKLPVRWDGTDLWDAENRVIVWGKESADDHDDVDRALGRWVTDMLNAAAVPRRAEPPPKDGDFYATGDYYSAHVMSRSRKVPVAHIGAVEGPAVNFAQQIADALNGRAEPPLEPITIVGTCREGYPHFCANCGNSFTALRAEPTKET